MLDPGACAHPNVVQRDPRYNQLFLTCSFGGKKRWWGLEHTVNWYRARLNNSSQIHVDALGNNGYDEVAINMAYHPDVPKSQELEKWFARDFDLEVIVFRIREAVNSPAEGAPCDAVTVQQHLIDWLDHAIDAGAAFDKVDFYNEDTCQMELKHRECMLVLQWMFTSN